MNRIWKKVIAAALAVAVLVAIRVIIVINRPIVEAPWGTAPLDNRADLSGVAHLIVDEAGVLSEKTEKIISIYNANWTTLENRVMAVVTVENTEHAEDDAWQWVQRLSLTENDALLLLETKGSKDCVLVSNGTFREDIATLDYVFLKRLTFTNIHADDFDAAVLAVYEELHYLFGFDIESYRRSEATAGLVTLFLLAALIIPILIHMIAEKVDGFRFKRWYTKYGMNNPPIVPWKSMFLWHRAGSKWYEARISGEWIDYTALLRNHRRARNVKAAKGRYR